jgi:hypothetical protein
MYSEKIFPVPFCAPKIPNYLTWARTRTAAMESLRLIRLSYGMASTEHFRHGFKEFDTIV